MAKHLTEETTEETTKASGFLWLVERDQFRNTGKMKGCVLQLSAFLKH